MKFLDEQGNEATLKRSKKLPGYEVTLSEDVVIDSPVNNPFFKGINILQLPKKLKGFRDNADLQNLFIPQTLNTGIKLELDDDEIVFFEPNNSFIIKKKLLLINRVFGINEVIQPKFINYGLKKVKLEANTVIGTVFIQKNVI